MMSLHISPEQNEVPFFQAARKKKLTKAKYT